MKKLVCLDVESYPNYWMVAFKSLETNKVIIIETTSSLSVESKKKLTTILNKYTSFGYNSIHYDLPMITAALNGYNVEQLHKLTQTIIKGNSPSFITYKTIGIEPPSYDHFDIKEPSPAVMISLKNYGTRVGSKRLWDLPYDPMTTLSDDEIENLKLYCVNDLDTTIDLYNAIKDRIHLRTDMREQYSGIEDLRSKSDAQVAESIFKFELNKKGVKIPYVKATDRLVREVTYNCPNYIKFSSEKLTAIKNLFDGTSFKINQANGQPIIPKEFDKLIKPKIGKTTYKLGLGGIHSQEKCLTIESNQSFTLRNADIASMYPSIILELGLYSKTLGIKWLDIYRDVYIRRLKAKKEGDKLVNEILKLQLNGSYGKFGSMYSFLYSPDLMLTVTITGQLMMLMLIEQLELNGFEVVSANTDGVEYTCHTGKEDIAEAIIFDWELVTGMNMEHGTYKALYAKDVNNYVAVYDGYTKCKGVYGETTLMKGRSTPIVYTAIREHLLNGTRLEDTIRECKDINEFVSGRTVKGGGKYGDEYLGKVVRWFYCTNSNGYIEYVANGNKVPKTDGACPLMDLPDTLPKSLDYQWYIDEAISKLKDLGVGYA
jgi:hypothetical protein